jgi:formylmethanofuran dehydrogenase subunit E
MTDDEKVLEQRRRWLKECIAYHGHNCMGQVLGVRLAERGMELIGTTDRKKMIVFVENDRCIADAIQIVTGTRLGRRSMKLRDYGKMAATFYNCDTGEAYRVWVGGNIDAIAMGQSVDKKNKEEYKRVVLEAPTEQLLKDMKVEVDIREDEMPGKPRRTVICDRCGEKIMDSKDVGTKEGILCESCFKGAYYRPLEE